MRKRSLKLVAAAVGSGAISMLATVTAYAQSYRYDYGYDDIDALAGAGFLGGFGIIWVCVCCIALIVPLVCAFVVYRDAEKNNVENGILWAVLSFLFPLIGLLIYFLAIKPEAMKKNGTASTPEKKE